MEWKIINGDCTHLLADGIAELKAKGLAPVIVTDPPFNVGYKYRTYKDRKPEADYLKWLAQLTAYTPSVVILYPEMLHKLTLAKGEAPTRVVSWVYNSNTAKQHRDVAFYGISPDFNRVKQPYKNLQDKRIQARMANGGGAHGYTIGGMSTR